jgi:hypothetical protein
MRGMSGMSGEWNAWNTWNAWNELNEWSVCVLFHALMPLRRVVTLFLDVGWRIVASRDIGGTCDVDE